MTAENLELVRALGKIFNDGEYHLAEKLIAPDFVDHDTPNHDPHALEGYAATARWIRSVVAEPRWVEEDAVATGDRVVVRLRFSGTQIGEVLGVPPTGRTFSIQEIHVYRVAGGLIAEHWAVRDDLGMLQQLGVVPGPYA
jgi:predicted ester cyclase